MSNSVVTRAVGLGTRPANSLSMCGSLLAAGQLATGRELEIAELSGMQRCTSPEVSRLDINCSQIANGAAEIFIGSQAMDPLPDTSVDVLEYRTSDLGYNFGCPGGNCLALRHTGTKSSAGNFIFFACSGPRPLMALSLIEKAEAAYARFVESWNATGPRRARAPQRRGDNRAAGRRFHLMPALCQAVIHARQQD